MADHDQNDMQDAAARFARFRAYETSERVFSHPIRHPSSISAFCPCDLPFLKRLRFYCKAALMELVLKTPLGGLKARVLRRAGVRLGSRVYMSECVWIDPLFPELLTIEDDVMIGREARIGMHTFDTDEFVAGKVAIRRGAVIGSFSIIGPGVEIGEGATVAPGAVVGRDVPAGCVALGNPARILPKKHPNGRGERP